MRFNLTSKCLLVVSMSMIGCLGIDLSAAEVAAARSLPKAAPASSLLATNELPKVVIPVSEFDADTNPADPFYPNAKYLKKNAPEPVAGKAVDGDAALAPLRLMGLGGVGEKRWAMVNGTAVYLGEYTTVTVGNKAYKITCVEIKERSVVVGLKDSPARRELNLQE